MPLTILEVDGKTITVMLEQLRVVTKKFQRNVFAKSQVRLIDKKLASDPTKRGFYSIREHLELCILMAIILKVTISSLFRLIYTFTLMLVSLSTRVFSSVAGIAFFSVLFVWPH